MRRVLPFLLSPLLLAACMSTERLPAEEVLRRAAVAGQELQSTAFEGRADISQTEDGKMSRWIISLTNGLMQQGGNQLSFSATIEQTTGTETSETPFRASVDTVLLWNAESFVRLNALEGTTEIFGSDALAKLPGKWWVFPAGDQDEAMMDVVPDPRILRAQIDVITVTDDHGIESIGGTSAYHYTVALDPAKLKTFLRVWAEENSEEFDEASVDAFIAQYDATGDVWIESTDFTLHRLSWVLTGKDEAEAKRLSFFLSFSDHNRAPAVTIPSDAEPFSLSALLGDESESLFPVLP